MAHRQPARTAARLGGFAALLLAGCAGPAHHGTTLEFWTIGREGEAVAQLLPAFEQANPGIRVRVQQIPLTAAHEKLLTRSEEHTSELQSPVHLVCRLLLEKKKNETKHR